VFVCGSLAAGYFLKDDTPEKQLFEHHQEMLEKNTERLHEYTEQPLETMDRTQIVNLTRVTERFLSSLLNSITNGVVTLPNAADSDNSGLYINGHGSKHADSGSADDMVHDSKRVRSSSSSGSGSGSGSGTSSSDSGSSSSSGGSEAMAVATDDGSAAVASAGLGTSPIAVLSNLWRRNNNQSK
jgi:uncharacterized membrane protein YgcG